MSDYTMPVLSEQERESLINHCKSDIAHYARCVEAYPDSPVVKFELYVYQIALAALTAHSVGEVVYGETSGLSVDYHDNVTVGDSLYLCPPVPVKQEGEHRD